MKLFGKLFEQNPLVDPQYQVDDKTLLLLIELRERGIVSYQDAMAADAEGDAPLTHARGMVARGLIGESEKNEDFSLLPGGRDVLRAYHLLPAEFDPQRNYGR